MAQIYKLNLDFADKYNFLRVRSSCSVRSDDNVVYKVQTSDLANVQWQVDENESQKEWFKVVSADRSDGTRIGGAGWALKTYEDVVTLVPEMRKYLRPNTPATSDDDLNRSTGRLVRSMTDRAAAEGRDGLNPEWVENEFSNPDLRRAVFQQGAAAWEYKFDGTKFGKHLRVVMRHGIVTDEGPRGRGVPMAAACHAAAAATAETANANATVVQFTADVIVTFLEAIPGAVKAHQNAGYTALKGVDRGGLTLMYHQECRLGVQALREAQVRQLFSEYC